MQIVFVSIPIIIILFAAIVKEVQWDYTVRGSLSIMTVFAVWLLYLFHAATTIYSAWRGFYPLPIPKTLSLSIGSVSMLFGLTLTMAGILSFRSIKRMSGLQANKLFISDVYRWSRNPQNVGWRILLLGLALLGRSGLAFILVALFWLIFRIYVPAEEKYLKEVFGDEYRQYCTKAPRYF